MLGRAAKYSSNLSSALSPKRMRQASNKPGASRMVMRGREMDGWLRVTSEAVESDDVLEEWVRLGVGYGGTLPAK